MPRTPSETKIIRYLQRMRECRGVVTPETGYYPPLQELLNAIGEELKPKVRIVSQPKGAAAGVPDFGFYTEEQLRRTRKSSAPAEKPARGAAEIKPLSADIGELLNSEQVKKYALSSGVVLAANYREFALAEMQNGAVREIDRRAIAASEEEFWQRAEHPQKTAAECAEEICQFLSRALSHNAPIASAEDLARILASFAREILARLERDEDESVMRNLRGALESSLQMKFEGADGGRFFRSTLAQTIVYGMFSAWMESDETPFHWRGAGWLLKNPVMKTLFGEISKPDNLGRMNLEKMLDGAAAALDRVPEKSKLFGGADAAIAIQHFYEPFLAAFDPTLRKEMGVWYTPPEIVRYMVERVDRVLREELQIADGFAADNVYVLDPCGGTGAYIAEVLRRIHKTCAARGDGDLAAAAAKTAAQTRVIGFEILSASYVVAHWQIGALLKNFGAPLKDDERAAIYLTNSLTNWTPAEQPPLDNFPGLEEERDAANEIKQQKPILVILGNPPYNAFAGTSPEEEEDLVAAYKAGLYREWGVRKFNLDDLYVRFFAMAEKRIAKTGSGIVSFISNYSYTAEPSFVVMRKSLLRTFDRAWVENMHGDRNKSERAPDGRSSNTVFAMRGFSPGIRQGIVVGLFCKTSGSESDAEILYRNDIDAADAEERRAQLLASLDETGAKFNARYEKANPDEFNKLSFRPLAVSGDFARWAAIDELYEQMENGMVEARGGALIDIDRDALESRMRDYFNSEIEWEEYLRAGAGLVNNAADLNAKETRKNAVHHQFNSDNIARYTNAAFDERFCYYTGIRPIWNRNRPKLWKQFKPGNSFLVSRPRGMGTDEGAPALFTTALCDYGAISLARCIPFYLYSPEESDGDLVSQKRNRRTANLSETARAYLRKLKFANPDEDEEAAEILWLHSLAVCYAPDYQSENADGLRIGWPRIPLPPSAETLRHSAALGKKVRALLDIATPLRQTHLAPLATFRGNANNLALSESWGYKDGAGKTYPGAAKPEAMTLPPEYAPFADSLGAPLAVRLNAESRWECVPARVWKYRIGGFQPPKKWLSYRAEKVLHRPLRPEEAKTFTEIIRRIAALILLEKELNGNYWDAGTKNKAR